MTAAITIIAKNYLAYARTLMQSVKTHMPEWRRTVILVDECEGMFIPEGEDFEVIEISGLPIPKLPLLRFKYTLMELSTAVKPFVVRYLFETCHFDKIFYFDPDILVLAPLGGLEEGLERGDILLTPHCCVPLPPDRFKPHEKDLLMAGVYNLGFIGLRYCGNTSHFLHWWEAKLYDGAFADFSRHLFTDQKWIDLVPALFPRVVVERSQAHNVAYWNLPTRPVVRRKGQWTVDGEPVGFFHFSGLDPEEPAGFAKHQDRYRLEDLGELKDLVHCYCAQVLEHGYRESRNWRYTYDFFANGRPLFLHESQLCKEDSLFDLGNPFSEQGYRIYLDYWNSPAQDERGRTAPGLTRFAHRIYQSRPDVQQSSGDVFGAGTREFLEWLVTTGAVEYPSIDEGLLQPLVQHLERTRQPGRQMETVALQDGDMVVTGRMSSKVAGPVLSLLLRSRERLEGAQRTLESDGSIIAWLIGHDDKLPRLARWIYDDRPDLQEAMPEVAEGDLRIYARWLAAFAGAEYHLPKDWVWRLTAAMGAGRSVPGWWGRLTVKLRLAARRFL